MRGDLSKLAPLPGAARFPLVAEFVGVWALVALLGAVHSFDAWPEVSKLARTILFVLIAGHFHSPRVHERWDTPLATEWRLAHGLWTRERLARALLIELFVVALNRALATTVLVGFFSDAEFGRAVSWLGSNSDSITSLGMAFGAALALQSSWLILGNAPYSNRTQEWWRRGDLLRSPLSTWAPNLRTLAASGVLLAILVGSVWIARSAWGLAAPAALFTGWLAWMLPAFEASGGGSQTPRAARRKLQRRRPRNFAPLIGVLWEGSTRNHKLGFAAVVLLAIAYAGCAAALGESDLQHALALGGSVLLALSLRKLPFRWRSTGVTAAHLCALGVELRLLRRTELLFGLSVALAMVGIALVSLPLDRHVALTAFLLLWPACSALLLSNRTGFLLSSRWRLRRARNVCVVTHKVALGLAVALGIASRLVDGPWSPELVAALLWSAAVLFAFYCAAAIGLWCWGFSKARDEGALREVEFVDGAWSQD